MNRLNLLTSREYEMEYTYLSATSTLNSSSPPPPTTRNISVKQTLTFFTGILIGLTAAIIIRRFALGSIHFCFTEDSSKLKQPTPFDIIGGDETKYPHNSDDNLLFVGVMTAQQYLDTRAVAVYETWAQEIPGKVAFFTSEHSVVKSVIPVIRLKGVDDSYPPQKKSFMMLKYMYDHFLNHYEFFMRADDDLYARPDKLEKFLRSVNSSQLQFIGQTGKGNIAEFGQLSLLDYENFCMGGPGVIFSKSTLARVAPHVQDCLQNMHSTHEDVELGRCVQRFAEIPCTWSYEVS